MRAEAFNQIVSIRWATLMLWKCSQTVNLGHGADTSMYKVYLERARGCLHVFFFFSSTVPASVFCVISCHIPISCSVHMGCSSCHIRSWELGPEFVQSLCSKLTYYSVLRIIYSLGRHFSLKWCKNDFMIQATVDQGEAFQNKLGSTFHLTRVPQGLKVHENS